MSKRMAWFLLIFCPTSVMLSIYGLINHKTIPWWLFVPCWIGAIGCHHLMAIAFVAFQTLVYGKVPPDAYNGPSPMGFP